MIKFILECLACILGGYIGAMIYDVFKENKDK